MTFVGLILIALGTGGIKPCVSAFGGDQFKEEQKSLLPKFFSIFYFSINAGSLISTFLTPIFRADVQCFGQDCYALAFGIPAGLMIVSLIIFIIGSPLYIKHRPQCGKFWELVIFKFLISSILIVYKGIVMCVKVTVGKVTGRVLWKPSSSIYQTAEAKYGAVFVSDVKDVLKVLVMFLPLPIFWALFDQQGSRWTLQATQMNGEIAGGFRIQPDQVQTLNPLLILVFIPLFEVVVYPLLAKCKLLTRPLQRMVTGMTLASLSFVVAALVQIYIDQSLDVIPQGQGRLSFANPTNISMTVESVDGQPLNWTLGYHDVSSTLGSVAFLEAHVTSSLVPPPSSLIHHPSPFTTHPSSLTTYYSPIHSVTPLPSPTPHSLFTLTYPQSPLTVSSIQLTACG
jgi:dipeptide/tripeptide permease